MEASTATCVVVIRFVASSLPPMPVSSTTISHCFPGNTKSQRRLNLKRRRMMEAVTYHSITMLFNDLQSFAQILMRDLLLSDLDFSQ